VGSAELGNSGELLPKWLVFTKMKQFSLPPENANEELLMRTSTTKVWSNWSQVQVAPSEGCIITLSKKYQTQTWDPTAPLSST
jgi:hypothetical protein